MQLNTENEDSQHSTIQCEMGVLTRSDGSAIVRQGETIVVAAIHGPTESKMQRMLIEKSNVEAHYRPKSGLPGVSDRFKESVIRNTCETILMATLYPRSTISVVIQEIQDCGELLACAINAACLALLDSGIEMKFLYQTVSCSVSHYGHIHTRPVP
ncbi:Rrp46 [Carabus blaptoides fortunei]